MIECFNGFNRLIYPRICEPSLLHSSNSLTALLRIFLPDLSALFVCESFLKRKTRPFGQRSRRAGNQSLFSLLLFTSRTLTNANTNN